MITDQEKIERFDRAHELLYDLAFKAPEIRPETGSTVDRLTDIICNGQ